MPCKYSRSDEKSVIKLYNDGYSAYEIQDILDIEATTIYKWLKKNNIRAVGQRKTRKKNFRSEKLEQKIIEMYVNGFAANKIVKKIGYKTTKSVYDILEKYNIKRRTNEDYHNFNIDYFEKINTKEKAYLLGWLISDGWVYTNSNGIGIQLQDRDIKIIKLFKKELNSTAKISDCYKKNYDKPMKRIIFISAKTKNDLKKYGVVEKKAKKTYLPNLKNKFIRHLLRGILEGDGSVFFYNKTNSIHIIFNGSKKIIQEIRDFLSKRLRISKPKIVENACHRVCWTSYEEVMKILCYIYYGCGNLYLERKYNVARKYKYQNYKSEVFKEFRKEKNIQFGNGK